MNSIAMAHAYEQARKPQTTADVIHCDNYWTYPKCNQWTHCEWKDYKCQRRAGYLVDLNSEKKTKPVDLQ